MNYVAYVFLIAIKLYTIFFYDNGRPLIVKHLFTLDLYRVKVYSYSLLPCRYKYINKSIKYIQWKKMVSCIDKITKRFSTPYISTLRDLFVCNNLSVVNNYDG